MLDPLLIVLGVALVGIGAFVVVLLRERGQLLEERSRLRGERDVAQAKLSDEERMRESFKALASDALRGVNEQFLALANQNFATHKAEASADLDKRKLAVDQLVKPIQEAILKTQERLEAVGKDHAGLRQQIVGVQQASLELRGETSKLANALRAPNVRGRYGEIQLRRIVELAGMKSYCDFGEQVSLTNDAGKGLRPDLVVRLPNDRFLAIDAKTSGEAYLQAIDAKTEEERDLLLARYADHVADQVQKLSRKEYWAQFDSSPDFVVLFMPADQLVDVALSHRADLIDVAAQANVILASPSTLIGLLRAVHVGWREKSVSESARELHGLGKELHARAAVVLDRVASVGKSLEGARRSYNELVGSLESRWLPTLRKFEEKGADSGRELAEIPRVEGETRELAAGAIEKEWTVPSALAAESNAAGTDPTGATRAT